MRHLYHILTILVICCIMPVQASDNTAHLYRIDIHEDIGSSTWRYLQSGVRNARESNADAIILHLNTSIPVYAYIENNAASAGALIALACDSIYMQDGSRMGAATVIDGMGNTMPDKYQSYMRATMRATAEAQGQDTIVTAEGDTILQWRRNPLIAEAMVDERVVVPGICDSTKVLTFTANEALQYGYCEGIVSSVNEMITQHLHIDNYTLEQFTPSLYDRLVGWLTNPALQAILITLIIGGIFFELKAPGVGLPSAIACIAAVLYFMPLFVTGSAESWEIIVFFLGIILLIIEFFVVPGFGVPGIIGIVCVIGSLILVMLFNVNFDFTLVTGNDISRSIFTVLAGLVVAVILLVYISHRIGNKGFLYNVALHAEQRESDGYVAVDEAPRQVVGTTGTALTRMAPSGKVRVNNEIYDGISLYGQYIEADTTVRIEKYENNQLYVTPAQKQDSQA